MANMSTIDISSGAEHDSSVLENKKYFLDNFPHTKEISRLNNQYMMLKALFGYDDILNLPLDFSKAGNISILDAAAGTGVWLLDVARIPSIQARLSSPSSNSIKLYACDITSTKFAPNTATDPLGISFFLQDITNPFPLEMKQKFDLVHLSLMSYAFTLDAWTAALSNIFEILKPGGYLILMDYDFGAKHPTGPPLRGDIWDVNTYISNEPSLVNRINSIFVWGAHQNGYLIGLSYHLQNILKSLSYDLVSLKKADLYYGEMGRGRPGLDGKLFDQYRDIALANIGALLDGMSKVLLMQDDLEVPRGKSNKITTEEERRIMLQELLTNIKEEGCFGGLSEIVAQKPM